MKPHELNRMFHGLAPDPEREQALLEELLQNDTRRETSVKNWKRIAVCAAVAALLMTCTIGAVATVSSFLKVETAKDPNRWGWYSVSGGITYFPMDSLSDEIMAQEGQGLEDSYFSNHTYFDSWDRVEEFVGMDLMNNPVLDAAAEEVPYSELNVSFFDSRYVVMHDSNLRSIKIHGDYQTGDVSVRLDYDIFTERSLELEENVRGIYLWYDVKDDLRNDIKVEEEHYTAPSGLETTIVKTFNERATCEATISLNGVRVSIITASPNGNMKESRKAMIKVLNGFTP